MGGCRCSYRNCSVRSDGGKTHMFHYPVYDKQRCRQWLMNSQKLEYLDLNVSQLKNRVVCQYHFPDDAFMNCMHNRLKFDAVPTLNGPYCDPDSSDEADGNDTIQNDLSHIFIDDTDNAVRLSVHEKQASQVLKYADFLTSNDAESEFGLVDRFQKKPKPSDGDLATSLIINGHYSLQPKTEPSNKKVIIDSGKKLVEIEIDAPRDLNSGVRKSSRIKNPIKILSEKKITTPPKVNKNKLQLVSPSTIINAPKQPSDPKLEQNNLNNKLTKWPNENSLHPFEVIINNNIQNVELPIENNISNINNMPIVFLDGNNALTSLEHAPSGNKIVDVTLLNTNDEHKPEVLSSSVKNRNTAIRTNTQASPNVKAKMPPERVAAIEEKRNFNKKLRDMIEFCLDEFDDPEKMNNAARKPNTRSAPAVINPSKSIVNKPDKTEHTNDGDQHKIQNIKLQQNQTAVSERALASLEAKIANLQKCLAQKIEQNTQKIADLKDYIQTPENMFSRSPTENEEVHKKRLFKEISQFLSPDANNLIYEELFINKYGKNVPEKKTFESKPSKRQKRR